MVQIITSVKCEPLMMNMYNCLLLSYILSTSTSVNTTSHLQTIKQIYFCTLQYNMKRTTRINSANQYLHFELYDEYANELYSFFLPAHHFNNKTSHLQTIQKLLLHPPIEYNNNLN